MGQDAMTREQWEQGHKALEHIILFPGSLEELNSLGIKYEFVPLQLGEKFLVGRITPRLSDLWLHMTVTSKTPESDYVESVKRPASSEQYNAVKKIVEESFLQMGLQFFERDIRHRAMVDGVDGLIHVQLYSATPQLYMGVPVKKYGKVI